MSSPTQTEGPAPIEAKISGAEVAPGIRRFDDGIVNWYLLEEDGRYTAVDAGFPPAWTVLTTALGVLGARISDLAAVVLTHAHIDHIGFAERARQEAGATVYVHGEDGELLEHPLSIARSERNPLLYLNHPATRALILRALTSGAPVAKRVSDYRTFSDGEVLDTVPGSPRVGYTPGHTLGHCVLHMPDRGVLFSGDAIVTRNPYTGEIGPRMVSAATTADTQQNLASLDRIAELEASLVLPGHGEPWTQGTTEAARLARAAGPS